MFPLPIPDDPWLSAWQAANREPVLFSDDPHVWRMLAAAWQRGAVEFRYRGGSTPGSCRRMTPASVFTMGGGPAIYAEAFCHLRGGVRTFRLDRVEWPR